MKKIFIILAIIFIAINLQAQWFLGGSLGLNVSSTKDVIIEDIDYTYKRTEVGFMIAPKAYYHFNEKFALGLGFSVGPNFITLESDKVKLHSYSINWRVFPLVRYSMFTYKKFTLILEGRTGVGGVHSIEMYDVNKSINLNTLAIGVFNITPVLGFNLSDHLQLQAALHFLNVGYNIDIYKKEIGSSERNYTKHDFNIGFNSSSILVVTQLSIGAVYKF